MDTQSLFSKKKEAAAPEKVFAIAVGNEIDDQPLIAQLKQRTQIKTSSPEQRFELIRNGAVDMAFISAIDFARLKGGWKIIPGICKYTEGASAKTVLLFNKNIAEIKSIAVHSASSTEAILLKIILLERYEIECDYAEVNGTAQELLKEHDAVLLTGDKALEATQKYKAFIDLDEEWYDMTGLPFVYGFWIGNELSIKYKDINALIDITKKGIPHQLIEEKSHNLPNDVITAFLEETVNYNYGENQGNALIEFYTYAFFYGFTKYVPDLNFYSTSE